MTETLAVARANLEYELWGAGPPRIVMLHDGLGSIAQWRTTPARLAEGCGVAVFAYNRAVHGESTPIPGGPWPTRWLHHEADVLADLLQRLDIVTPFIVGHSDGGSIALLHALKAAGPSGVVEQPITCSGLVGLAPHSFVEPICVEAIAAMRANPDRTIQALAPFHRDPEATFEAWSGVWVSEEFGRWDIRPRLSTIDVPTWIVQGDADRYATEAQLHSTVEAIGDNATGVALDGFGHLIHHDDVETVVQLVSEAFTAVESPV